MHDLIREDREYEARQERLEEIAEIHAAERERLTEAARDAETFAQLEDILGDDLNWLEESRGCTRWAIGPEDSVWVCNNCERVIADPDDGCEHCARDDDDSRTELMMLHGTE
ncbi:hypothetical protein [Thiocystis violacea]|uniref:hypothetical protein n=1 Tax=Thiocystis violacea TaxID=13725 RepID=UPI00190426E0|nr:hypothetical protein [Thiocystis violacea]MBK1722813.1 hypothetical protein [Thiocystis violacea]